MTREIHRRERRYEVGPLLIKAIRSCGGDSWHVYDPKTGLEVVDQKTTLKRAIAAATEYLKGL